MCGHSLLKGFLVLLMVGRKRRILFKRNYSANCEIALHAQLIVCLFNLLF